MEDVPHALKQRGRVGGTSAAEDTEEDVAEDLGLGSIGRLRGFGGLLEEARAALRGCVACSGQREGFAQFSQRCGALRGDFAQARSFGAASSLQRRLCRREVRIFRGLASAKCSGGRLRETSSAFRIQAHLVQTRDIVAGRRAHFAEVQREELHAGRVAGAVEGRACGARRADQGREAGSAGALGGCSGVCRPCEALLQTGQRAGGGALLGLVPKLPLEELQQGLIWASAEPW